MRYEEIAALRATAPRGGCCGLTMLPLILSSLGRALVEENVRNIVASQLISQLDNELAAKWVPTREGRARNSCWLIIDP
jgi:hypothetical protein